MPILISSPVQIIMTHPLYEEAMEEPILESLKTEDNPRDGLQSSLFDPTLPNLGPGDIEVAVVRSIESDATAEEIVDNKTSQKRGAIVKNSQRNHKICRGCSAVGHVLE